MATGSEYFPSRNSAGIVTFKNDVGQCLLGAKLYVHYVHKPTER
jgi:hypothetical protein